VVDRTVDLLKAENRCFLHVFRLDRDINVAETVFKAIFKGKIIINNYFDNISNLNLAIRDRKKQNSSNNTVPEDNIEWAKLALKWNYFNGFKEILELPTYKNMDEQKTMIEVKLFFLYMGNFMKNRTYPAFI
jgi:hypothetical protein